jgi:hypothetical protein
MTHPQAVNKRRSLLFVRLRFLNAMLPEGDRPMPGTYSAEAFERIKNAHWQNLKPILKT